MSIANHTQLIQAIIDKYSLKSYLEIGVNNPYNNFHKIKCKEKIGIEPCLEKSDGSNIGYTLLKNTSDSFFETNLFYKEQNPAFKTDFDIVFIDGDHTAEQVKKDFENSLKCLSDNGFIIVHDILPEIQETTKVPRETRCWHGTVYEWAMTARTYDDIAFVTYNIDEGCMVIRKQPGNKGSNHYIGEFKSQWEQYQKEGAILLNVVNEVII